MNSDVSRVTQAMRDRSRRDSNSFREQLICILFRITLRDYLTEAAGIARLVTAAGSLKKLRYPEETTVAKLAAAGLTDREFADFDGGLRGTDEWRDNPFLPIVFHQRANRPGDVITALGALRKPVRDLVRRDRVYIAAGFDFAGNLPLGGVATASRGRVLLAIIGFQQHDNAHCRQYLTAYLAAVPAPLAWAGDFQVTHESLTRDLGPRVQHNAANVRVGGAGNTAYLEPLTRAGRATADTAAHVEPDVASASVAVANNTVVHVIGKMPGWYAVEDGNGTRFIPQHAVAL